SGAFRGDLAQVGPDRCLYLSQDRTRYADATVSTEDSIVKICGGFASTSQSVVLTFAPGQNSSAIATFNCPSGLTPCPDPDAHSMKFIVGNVTTSFSVVLTATELDGDGICHSGIPGDIGDPIDCRFVRFFGEPPYTGTPLVNTKVPHCYPYSHGRCVSYHLDGAPPPPNQSGPYSGG